MIEVLKQALELVIKSKRYAEECSHMATQNDCDHFDAVAENLRKAIQEEALRNVQRIGQEIEQEPLAWISPSGALYRTRYHAVGNAEQSLTPLYTHPPQRTWQGLTHEQVDSWELPDCPTVFEFAQFIEAKLKQKNGFAEEKNA